MLQDNVHPRTVATESFHHLKFEVLKHPSSSPDLVPSHYHLFGSLEDASRSRHFTGG
jgi:hypothetical protein